MAITLSAIATINRFLPQNCERCRTTIPVGTKHYLVAFERERLVTVNIGGQYLEVTQKQLLGSYTLLCAECKHKIKLKGKR